MSDVKLLLTSRTGTFMGELPNASLSDPTWELNGPGGASVSINPLRAEAARIALNKTEIQIWIDDVYRHCVVPRAVTGDSKKITFQCEGILGYLAYRFINDSLTYGSPGPPPVYVDQFQIGWNLVSYAQTGTNRDLRIVSSAWAASGVGRLRKWDWFEHKEVLSELQSLTEVDNGFDFDIVLFGDGRREWTPYYPNKGVRRAAMTLEWGRNVVDFSFNESGVNQGTKVYATGGSSGDVKFEQNYEDAALSAEFGVIEKIVSVSSELDTGRLHDRAVEEVNVNGRPAVLPDLTVRDIPATNGQPAVVVDGVLQTGDIMPVNINHGRCQMVGDYRITKIVRKKPGQLVLSFNVWNG